MGLKKILKEYLGNKVGMTLYTPICGDVTLISVRNDRIIVGSQEDGESLPFTHSGEYVFGGRRHCSLFPSKELFQRYPLEPDEAWDEWERELNSDISEIKTWDDMCNHPNTSPTDIGFVNDFEKLIEDYDQSETDSAKSALALLKIRLLISEAYGGNLSTEEWKDYNRNKFKVEYDYAFRNPYIVCSSGDFFNPISFKSIEAAEEFLSYGSNLELVKDFYMVG